MQKHLLSFVNYFLFWRFLTKKLSRHAEVNSEWRSAFVCCFHRLLKYVQRTYLSLFVRTNYLQKISIQGCHAPINTKFPVFSLCSCHFPCVFMSTKNKVFKFVNSLHHPHSHPFLSKWIIHKGLKRFNSTDPLTIYKTKVKSSQTKILEQHNQRVISST